MGKIILYQLFIYVSLPVLNHKYHIKGLFSIKYFYNIFGTIMHPERKIQ
jgi:hypothetical protein